MANAIKLKRKYDPADFSAARYRVTMFLSAGMYPRGTFCTPNGVFHADPDIVFAVSFGRPWHAISEHLPYSEVDWLLPEVVRLLGSLMMAEQFPEGLRNRFYPLAHGGFVIDEQSLDLTRPETAFEVKKALLKVMSGAMPDKRMESTWSTCRAKEFDLFSPHELCIEEYQKYWVSISTENHVLMRGLQALIKSDMLAANHEFQEEATIATFIALDASFELVLRHLRANGIVNPSAKDAGDWLFRVFEEPLGVYAAEGLKYFEQFYEQRVQTVHPGSRFGDVPFAPVMVDDYIHLRQSLPGIFAFLTLGDHSPHFYREVADRKSYRERPVPPCGNMGVADGAKY